MRKYFGMMAALAGVCTLALSIPFAAEETPGKLTGLLVEDPAQLVDMTFDPATQEYSYEVFEDVFGIRFTPELADEAGVINVSVEGPDCVINVCGTEDEALLGQTSLAIGNGQAFEAHFTEKRECIADTTNPLCARGMEDPQDYTVTIEAADSTYTYHFHRPGTDALVEKFQFLQWDLGDGELQDYYLYVPEDYDESESYPLLLAPHGGGQTRNPAEDILVRTAQATAPVKYGKKMFVLAPQANNHDLTGEDTGWRRADGSLTKYGEGAIAILKDVMANYNIDEKRVYCAGCSMGGAGTTGFLINYPELFAAGWIGASGTNDEIGAMLAESVKKENIKVWFVHAETDPVANIENTRNAMRIFDENEIEYNSTIYPAGTFLTPTDHFSWVPFFDNEENIDWLMAQSK